MIDEDQLEQEQLTEEEQQEMAKEMAQQSREIIKELNNELQSALINFSDYHAKMERNRNFYLNSAFYRRRSGEAPTRDELKTNLLKVFADKNIHFTSPFPTIKVPTTGSSPEQRLAANTREKILHSVHKMNMTPLLWRKWAKDGTLFSAEVAETTFNLDKRCVEILRHDPRHCVWQVSNDNERRVIAFWVVYPITREEAERRYGVSPTSDVLANTVIQKSRNLAPIDGKEWFTYARRLDETSRVVWIGDQLVEEPHQHMMGTIPIDVCFPFDDATKNNQGSFYLDPLVPLQAELNHAIKHRANIVQRLGNPVIWGRGVHTRQFDDIKNNLSKSGGGFVGLKQQGELGLLQINDTNMIDNHSADIIGHMMRLSGFSAATFGESVGANTSGDALGMYFTPTVRLIEDQNIARTAFLESINSKILRAYDKFGMIGEEFHLAGYSPNGTLLPVAEDEQDYDKQYMSGGFDIRFDRTVIDGNYTNIVIPKPITPKNEIEEKRYWTDAADRGVVSKITAYEKLGIQSPEDELDLLREEQSDPVLNPQGANQILASIPHQSYEE